MSHIASVLTYRLLSETLEARKIPVGAKIWFAGEKKPYTVRASNIAFCVCTKPFNPKKTTLYTIIDWESLVRGPENLVFSMGAETDQECNEMLKRLTNGDSEVSSRNCVKLDIIRYELKNKKGN